MGKWKLLLVPFAAMLWSAGASAQGTTTNWDSTYESVPTNAEPISDGNEHIFNMKKEIQERLRAELCFGTVTGLGEGCGNASGGTPTDATYQDSGRSRRGSARVFFESNCAARGTLHNADDDVSAALDDGRLCVDWDTNQLFVNDASTNQGTGAGGWEALTFGGQTDLSDTTITSADDNDILRYDSTDSMWEDYAPIARVVDTGTLATAETPISNDPPARIALSGGAAAGDPQVTVPDAAATVPGNDEFTILVSGTIPVYLRSGASTHGVVQLEERCGAGAPPAVLSGTVVREYKFRFITVSNDLIVDKIHIDYVNNAPTAGNVCAYTILAADAFTTGAAGSDARVNPPALSGITEAGVAQTTLTAQLVPRRGLD